MATNPEFDLFIAALTQGGYTVSLRAASGVDLPPEPLQMALQLPALPEYRDIARFVAAAREVRLGADQELRDAKRVGGALFQALFLPEVRSRFHAARAVLPFDGRLLVRLRLPPALVAIPWELLYDAANDQFLALADDLALVRCPMMPAPLHPLQLAGALQVVVVLASPRGARAIDLDRELARVEAALRGPIAEGRVVLSVVRGPGTLEQLRRRLATPVHVLHILCHGDLDERRGEGVLLFEDASGEREQISAAQLRLLIEKQRGQTRLVVLNSCLGAVSGGNDPFGSVGAALMRGGVPAVVAMQFEIPAESAQELARMFYTDLADGRPIDAALTEARRHLFGYDSLRLDWAIPALFLRGDDGALFNAAQPAQPPVVRNPAGQPSQAPVLGAAELHNLRTRATAAFFARRWAEAEPLLAQLAAADPADASARSRLHLVRDYREVSELRAAGEWQAVLGALEGLARQPGFADPERHHAWAEAQQRRDAAYSAALAACERADWATALAALEPLLAEQPDDDDAAALMQRVREELAEQRRLAEAAAARKQAEEERQRKANEAAARKQAEEERRRQAAAVRARVIDPITANLSTRAYAAALGQLQALLKADAKDAEATALAAQLIENPAVPLAERLRAGDLAGQYGDPRPGVLAFPPAMAAFAGGSFQIGNTQAECQAIIKAEQRNNLEKEARDWYADTLNAAAVPVASFELARYPVTNAQWALFIAAGGYQAEQSWWNAAGRAWLARDRKDQPSRWDDARFGKAHPNYPVVGVNWYEAMAFCGWLTRHLHDGYTYTLPSELELEYAARGAARRMYAWGNQAPDAERANFEQTHNGSTAVGCFPAGATPEGLLDLAGNVWEWTRSEYRAYPYDPTDGREQADDPAKKHFTLRGGGWGLSSDPPARVLP
jgi:formylglycine-generating enzyme required for sulfatase activity